MNAKLHWFGMSFLTGYGFFSKNICWEESSTFRKVETSTIKDAIEREIPIVG